MECARERCGAADTNNANTREAEGNVILANGTVTFDSTTGLFDTESQTTKTFHFYNADPNMAINIDFGDSITTDGGTGLGGVTQFDAASSVSDIRQNGYASGALAGVNVDLDGKIVGTFTNGERRVLAAVALARFVNNDGLIREMVVTMQHHLIQVRRWLVERVPVVEVRLSVITSSSRRLSLPSSS